MKNPEAYKNPLPYPAQRDFTTVFFYKAGEVLATANTTAEITEAHREFPNAVTEKVVNLEAYRAAQNAYSVRDKELAEMFIIDLFKDNGLEDNAFTRKLYEIAYDRGHANGYPEIMNYFEDIVELDHLANEVYRK